MPSLIVDEMVQEYCDDGIDWGYSVGNSSGIEIELIDSGETKQDEQESVTVETKKKDPDEILAEGTLALSLLRQLSYQNKYN
uniref:Cdk5 regulatory subunit-associated protein 3 isoform x1 n=1 Tax=Triatoma infestans TaxID=30076 RepID=A0A170WYM0_TRIIF